MTIDMVQKPVQQYRYIESPSRQELALLCCWVFGLMANSTTTSLKPIFQRGVTDKRGVRPTIAREGSKLDFVRRVP